MLTCLRLVDFKSFADEAVPIAPFTLFVGPNASGKSNLFDALRLLQGLGLGLPLVDTLRGRVDGGRQIWPGIRGGLREIARHGAEAFAIESTWQVDGRPISHAIRCATEPTPRIVGEGIFEDVCADLDSALVTTGSMEAPPAAASEDATLPGSIHVARGAAPFLVRFQVGAERSFLAQFSALPQQRDTLSQIAASASLHQRFEMLLFLDLSPAAMRGYAPRGAPGLTEQGDNLSAVLYHLCREPGRKRDLVDWVSELCEPRIADIDFIEVQETGDVMLVLVEETGARVTARCISDGTLRLLALLAVLLESGPERTLLIEEPDVGLHPTRVGLLAELIERVAAARGIQVLATTHSPVLLERLTPESLANVVASGRDPRHGGTILRRLGDLRDFEVLRESRDVGHLFSTGWIERAL